MKNFSVIVAAFAASAVLLTGCSESRTGDRGDDREDGWDQPATHGNFAPATVGRSGASGVTSEGRGGVGAGGGRAAGGATG